jgi:ParB/RepB/Spo0J family partition protein
MGILSGITTNLPIKSIYYDKEFNCRGLFTPQSCLDLAQSMEKHGLQFPIVVQPKVDVPQLSDKYDYRLIVGHRRFTAATKLLHWKTIPADVRRGLTEQEARTLNFLENLERKNITLLDEAKALRAIFSSNTSYAEMARYLSKSNNWCKARWLLMDMPEEIQQDCAIGRLTATDLQILMSTNGEPMQIALAREIKMAKRKGESTSSVKRRLKRFGGLRRSRGRKDIHEMISYLMSERIFASPFRAMAWCSGDLTTEEFLREPNE